MQRTLIHKISHIFFQALNFLFGLIIFSLVAIAILKPDWIELFIQWMERQIQLLGNWNYLIAFTSSIVESFPVIGVLVP